MNINEAIANSRRWNTSRYGSVSPHDKFIIVAGEGETITVVEGWVGREAAERNCGYLNDHSQKYQGSKLYRVEEIDMDMKTFENKLPESGIEKRFKVEVIADSSGVWAGNAMKYATKDEAVAAARDLMGRWLLVREWRVLEFKFNPQTDAESWQNEVARS